MFGLSKEEKETARREREALADEQMATQVKNATIREGMEEDDIDHDHRIGHRRFFGM